MSYPDYRDFREQVKSLDGAGALISGTVDVSDGTGLPDRDRSALITAGAFATIVPRPVQMHARST